MGLFRLQARSDDVGVVLDDAGLALVSITTPGVMPEMCRKEYHRPNSDLLDQHDNWFHNFNLDQKPEKYRYIKSVARL